MITNNISGIGRFKKIVYLQGYIHFNLSFSHCTNSLEVLLYHENHTREEMLWINISAK